MNDMDTKTCTKCGAEKQKSEFYGCARAPDGLEWRCKSCMVQSAVVSQRARQAEVNSKARERYAANAELREARRIALNEWRKNNPEKVREQRKRAAISLLKRKQAGDSATLQMLSERYKRRYQNPSSRAKRIYAASVYAAQHPDRVRKWKLKSEREARLLLKDSYIRSVLNIVDAPMQLIDLQRTKLKICRATKQLKKEIKNV